MSITTLCLTQRMTELKTRFVGFGLVGWGGSSTLLKLKSKNMKKSTLSSFFAFLGFLFFISHIHGQNVSLNEMSRFQSTRNIWNGGKISLTVIYVFVGGMNPSSKEDWLKIKTYGDKCLQNSNDTQLLSICFLTSYKSIDSYPKANTDYSYGEPLPDIENILIQIDSKPSRDNSRLRCAWLNGAFPTSPFDVFPEKWCVDM